MKALEDLLQPTKNTPSESVIPQRLYTDPGAVGYDSIDMQTDIYNLIFYGNMPITGDVSVLDIGAGRGDVKEYLDKTYPNVNLSFDGVELNPLLASIGIESGRSIIIGDFIQTEVETHNIVTIIGTLNLNYGRDESDWDYLEIIINKAIKLANEKLIIALLHDNGGVEQYINYPIQDFVSRVLKFNMPFKIEYGKYPNLYTVTIFTNEQIFI